MTGKIFSFKQHMKNICQRAGQKVNLIQRIWSYLDNGEREKRVLYTVLIRLHFSYYLLTQTFCSGNSNNTMSRIQQTDSRITFNDKVNNFEIL